MSKYSPSLDNEYRLIRMRDEQSLYKQYITDYDIARVLDLLTLGRIYRDSELESVLRHLLYIKTT